MYHLGKIAKGSATPITNILVNKYQIIMIVKLHLASESEYSNLKANHEHNKDERPQDNVLKQANNNEK
jgi:hypothetical protein